MSSLIIYKKRRLLLVLLAMSVLALVLSPAVALADGEFDDPDQVQQAENKSFSQDLKAEYVRDAVVAAKAEEDTKLDQQEIDQLEEDIANMRASGMGWGDICHELGVHPSVLGHGHHKDKGHPSGKFGDELAGTDRDFQTGLAKGHGKDHSEGKGLGHDKASGHPGKSSGKGKGGKGGGKK